MAGGPCGLAPIFGGNKSTDDFQNIKIIVWRGLGQFSNFVKVGKCEKFKAENGWRPAKKENFVIKNAKKYNG